MPDCRVFAALLADGRVRVGATQDLRGRIAALQAQARERGEPAGLVRLAATPPHPGAEHSVADLRAAFAAGDAGDGCLAVAFDDVVQAMNSLDSEEGDGTGWAATEIVRHLPDGFPDFAMPPEGEWDGGRDDLPASRLPAAASPLPPCGNPAPPNAAAPDGGDDATAIDASVFGVPGQSQVPWPDTGRGLRLDSGPVSPETACALVSEARQVFGARAAGQLWMRLGLPVVPAMLPDGEP